MKKLLLSVGMLLTYLSTFSQGLEATAKNKMEELKALITQANSQGINTRKEEMSIRVAEVYLFYANWDEKNLKEVEADFEGQLPVIPLDRNANQFAKDIPDYQRNEVIAMLDERIVVLGDLINNKGKRPESTAIIWDQLAIQGNRIVQNGKPIFGNEWTFKPNKAGNLNLTAYFGNLGGYFYDLHLLEEKPDGSIELNNGQKNALKNLKTGTFGAPFLGGNRLAPFITQKYPDITDGHAEFTGYDIDHPQTKPLLKALFEGYVPTFKGKNMSKLGYLLANEPHWNTAGSWDIVEITKYTHAKFVTWLQKKHGNIATLNNLWNTSFANFKDASNSVTTPVPSNIQGNPKWYDFMRFNQERVIEYFKFMNDEIKRLDNEAKTHIKLIPFQWSNDDRGSGLDFEALMEMSDVIGHDAHMDGSRRFGEKPWQKRYKLDWTHLTMAFDFFHSIKPNAINYNSEAHMLFNVRFREAFLRPEYARASQWLATMHGLDMTTNWVWTRREDGSYRKGTRNATTVGQQPRVLFEVHSTMMDINSYGQEITELQEVENPVRIFYSETSAINKPNHMTNLKDFYESLYFEGYRLGFVTKNIIEKQNHNNWEFIVVKDTEFVLESELDALQDYLNNGGTILLDNVSLKKNEYGQNHSKSLTAGAGTIIPISTANVKQSILTQAESKGHKPLIKVTEVNKQAVNFKGVAQHSVRTTTGKNVISLVNLGVTTATLNLAMNGIEGDDLVIYDLLKGITIKNGFELAPENVLFLEVSNSNPESLELNASADCIKPSGAGSIKLDYKTNTTRDINIDIQDLLDFKIVGKAKQTVNGEDSVVINFDANETLRVGEEYRLNIYMTEEGKGFASTVTDIKNGVKVTVETDCVNTLSANDFELTIGKVNIYPNPFTDVLTIDVPKKKLTYQIFDLKGQRFEEGVLNEEQTKVNLENLAPGVYFIALKQKETSLEKVIKIVKQ
ncbi:T9SS type A sorting domain-containing protein [Aquimarina agarilytica]|uniref:T9SS type A sorting domain-containing protein n=1 Tax=Aquimarina agarilytica TaxID=1087449 RepID=UPI000287A3EB|nr:T9SS type A sorting domain-containing protein [Aquimarina agarilytica]